MTTLTKTRIEIADRHTSLCFLNKNGTTPGPLGFGGSSQYRDLYKKIAAAGLANYSDLAGKQGAILDKLCSRLPEDPYKPLKYWLWYMGRGPELGEVWAEAIPVLATLNRRIDIQLPPGFPAKVKILPQVLLYPFGWSTWVSVLISGEHTLDDLSALVVHIFQQSPFSSPLYAKPLTLSAHLDFVANGIRTDAFAGAATKDRKDVGLALVITVLEKHGGAPDLRALGVAGEQQLRSLVVPTGPASGKSFENLVFHFRSKDDPNYDLNYLVTDQLGRFVWMENLLRPEDKNQMKLECYHHNSFRALVQAWHFYGLIKSGSEDGLFQQWKKSKKKAAPANNEEQEDDPLASLMTTAFRRLDNFGYQNASLRAFLEADSIKKQIEASRKKAISAGLLTPDSGGNTQSGADEQ
jgi:hypothetical protein